jgi:hypothetical protein
MKSKWRLLLVCSLSFIQLSFAQSRQICPPYSVEGELPFLGAKLHNDQVICFYGIGEVEMVLEDLGKGCRFLPAYRGTRALPLIRSVCLGSIDHCALDCL